MQLKVIYPQGETSFKDVDQMRGYLNQLEQGLDENNLLAIEFVKLGFKRMRSRDNAFYPSVGQFVAACMPRPEDYDYLSADEAWTKATQQAHDPSKLDQLIYTTGFGKWSQIAAGKGEKEFKAAYVNNLVKHKTENVPLKTPVTALESKPKATHTEEDKKAARAVLDNLMGNLE